MANFSEVIELFYQNYISGNYWLLILPALIVGYYASKDSGHNVFPGGEKLIKNLALRIILGTISDAFMFSIVMIIGYAFVKVLLWPTSLETFFKHYAPIIKEKASMRFALIIFFCGFGYLLFRIKEYGTTLGIMYITGGFITISAGLRAVNSTEKFQVALAIGAGIYLIADGIRHFITDATNELKKQRKEQKRNK